MEWYIFAFASAVFVAITSILNKKVLRHEHALEFTGSRAVIIIILSLGLLPFVNFGMDWYVYVLIYFVSILVSGGTLFFMKSLRHGEISRITPLTNISPVFLLIIAFFMLGEVPTGKQYIGVFLLMIGAYSLEVGMLNKGFWEPIKQFFKSKIIHFLIFSLVIFSFTATFDRLIITTYSDAMTYLFFLLIFKNLNLFSLEVYRHGFAEIKKDLKKDFKLLTLDSLSFFLASLFYMIAVSFPEAMISLIIPIKRSSTLFTTIFGGKLFHEKNLLVKLLACIIMIWGAVFILI